MDIPRVIVGPLGSKLLFYQGHTYTMKARKNAINVRWICHHNKLYKCKATISTDNKTHTTVNRISSVTHCHPPNEEEMEELEKQMKVKKLAHYLLDDNIKPSDLVNESSTYKTSRSKGGEVSVASLKRRLRRDRSRLKKQVEQSMIPQKQVEHSMIPQKQVEHSMIPQKQVEQSMIPQKHVEHSMIPLTPTFLDSQITRIEENPHDSSVLGVAQQELTPVPSTSGVVPTLSVNTATSTVPSQPHVKPYVPVQADIRASAKHHVPVSSDLRPTPTPSVAKKPPTTPELNPLPPPPLEDDSPISVKWNTYATNMSSVMPSLLEDEKFVDVTLACDGKYIKCHKVILGACSPYFEELLCANPCQHPIILMKDFHFWEIRAIVDFIYRGVVNIPQHQLPKLLQVANVLQIKGLTGTKSGNESEEDDIRLADHSREPQSREPQSQVGSKLRKRSELPPSKQTSRSKTSESPAKKMKIISKSSSRYSFESHTSDESSNQSEVSQSTSSAMDDCLEPSTLLHSVCIKEETNYGVDDPPEYTYRNDQNTDEGNSPQLGQFQLLTLPGSRTIKQEENEDMLDSTDQDPLDLEPGVS